MMSVIGGLALGTVGAVAGIGIAAMGINMIANEVNQVVPKAKEELREKG